MTLELYWQENGLYYDPRVEIYECKMINRVDHRGHQPVTANKFYSIRSLSHESSAIRSKTPSTSSKWLCRTKI